MSAAKVIERTTLRLYLSCKLFIGAVAYLKLYSSDLFIQISSEFVGDGFSENLKFEIFWEGMPPLVWDALDAGYNLRVHTPQNCMLRP